MLIVITFSYGCGVLSPVGDFAAKNYQNIVCYFNTYYNSNKAFSAGFESIQKQNAPLTSVNYPYLDLLETLTEKPIVNEAKTKFDLVVEKCSRILNNYTKSSMVDDALFMMGKSYYYNQEYTRAERKFLELLKQFPESDLIPEAKIWCAKCFLKNRKEEDAFMFFNDIIKESTASEENENISNVYLLLSSYYMTKKDTANALVNYHKILSYTDEDAVKSQVSFRLGEIYEILDSTAIASENYMNSANFSVSYILKFWGTYKYALIQEKLGNTDVAIELITDLKESKRYEDFLSYSYLALAGLYHTKGDDAMAIGLYNYLDSTFRKTENSVTGYYELGLIYELKYKEYANAKESYQKSKEQQINIPAAVLASERLGIVDAYLKINNSLYLLDSTLQRLHIPDSSVVTFYDTVWSDKMKMDSLRKDSTKVNDSPANLKNNVDTAIAQIKTPLDNEVKIEKDSLRKTISKIDSIKIPGLEQKIDSVQTNSIASNDSLQKRSDTTKLIAKLAGKDSLLNKKSDSVLMKKPYDSIITRKEKKENALDSVKIAKTKIELAKKKVEYGELWLNKYENADSAIYWFNAAYEDIPKDSTLANYIFTLANAHEMGQQKSVSDSLHKIIVEKYPASIFLKESKLALGLSLVEDIDTALVLYIEADSLLEKDLTDKAVKILEKIIVDHPKSRYAAKSQYALGWISENRTNNFKKAIEEYRKLMEKYPNSEYASLIRAKMDTVEQYQPSKKPKTPAADSTASIKKKDNLVPLDTKPETGKDDKEPSDVIKSIETKEQPKDAQELIRKRPVRNIEDSK